MEYVDKWTLLRFTLGGWARTNTDFFKGELLFLGFDGATRVQEPLSSYGDVIVDQIAFLVGYYCAAKGVPWGLMTLVGTAGYFLADRSEAVKQEKSKGKTSYMPNPDQYVNQP